MLQPLFLPHIAMMLFSSGQAGGRFEKNAFMTFCALSEAKGMVIVLIKIFYSPEKSPVDACYQGNICVLRNHAGNPKNYNPKKLLTSTDRNAILLFESGYNIRNVKELIGQSDVEKNFIRHL